MEFRAYAGLDPPSPDKRKRGDAEAEDVPTAEDFDIAGLAERSLSKMQLVDTKEALAKRQKVLSQLSFLN